MENQTLNNNQQEWLKAEAYKDIKSGMVLGIVGCAICWLPIASIASIILGIIGLSKTNRGMRVYASMGEIAPGRRIPAKILTICAIVGGIIMTLYWIIMICAIGCIAVNAEDYFNEANRHLNRALEEGGSSRHYRYY